VGEAPNLRRAEFLSPTSYSTRVYNNSEECHVPRAIFDVKTDADPSTRSTPSDEARLIPANATDSNVSFQQFTYCLTLFPKFFHLSSRYLFAIGLSPVFSFRWNLHPIELHSKQLDSSRAHHIAWQSVSKTGFSPSTSSFQETYTRSSAEDAS